MRFIYYCEGCQEMLEEVDSQDVSMSSFMPEKDSLTEEDWEAIIKLKNASGQVQYLSTLCADCIGTYRDNYQSTGDQSWWLH